MPAHTLPTTVPPTPAATTTPVATRRTAALVALLFLGATTSFVAGDALVVGALDGPAVDTGGLLLGVALQAVNALAVAGLGVAFLRVLPGDVRRLALGHLALRIVEAVVIIGIGGWMIATESLVDYEPVIYVFTGGAGLLLTAALARTQLVERPLVRLGTIGYVAILSALPLQLLTSVSLASFPGLLLYVPGGLFEFVLPVLLLVRGFRTTAPAAEATATTDPRSIIVSTTHPRHPAETMTLGEYVLHRTGRPLGAPGSLRAMLARSFGARSFAAFWQHWNPIWGYALGRFVHGPLRRHVPAAAAVLATFAVSGLLHDAAATLVRGSTTVLVTPWFVLLGTGVLAARAAGVDLSRLPWWARAAVHLAHLIGCLGLTLGARTLLGLA